jgi:hypothetical protein
MLERPQVDIAPGAISSSIIWKLSRETHWAC